MLQSVMSRAALSVLWRRWAAVPSAAAVVVVGLAVVPVSAQGGSGGGGPLVGFTLVDASDQSAVAVLGDGATVVLARPDSGLYGVRADIAAGASVGSVSLELEGPKTAARTENAAPYSLYGDYTERVHDQSSWSWKTLTRLFGYSLPVGDYVLRASAFSERALGGDELGTLEVSFSVAADAAAEPGPVPKPITGFDGCVVTSPPGTHRLDVFHAKYCSAGGIRVLAPADVPDIALQAAWNSIMNTLAAVPEVHERLGRQYRAIVLGVDDRIGDLPGFPDLEYRGVHSRSKRVLIVPEENVLCHDGEDNEFAGYEITVHETAHAMFYELRDMDSSFWPRLKAAFAQAQQHDLWDGYYAGTNQGEYWAEGVRFFLHGAWGGEGEYAPVSRRELAERDPVLYSLVSEYVPAFGADEWQPFCVGRDPVVPVAPTAPRWAACAWSCRGRPRRRAPRAGRRTRSTETRATAACAAAGRCPQATTPSPPPPTPCAICAATCSAPSRSASRSSRTPGDSSPRPSWS